MTGARRFGHVIIRASAGTGKTYQLSNRFIALVAAGEPPDHILSATFARKAAAEILDRVLVRLADAALDSEQPAAIAELAGDSRFDQKDCLLLLKKLIRHMHRLRIGTLDSFFTQLAASFSLELGLPPGWGIIDQLEDKKLRDEAIQRVLEGESTSELVTLMHLLSKGVATRPVKAEIRDVVDRLYDLFCETDDAAWEVLPRLKQLGENELQAAIGTLGTIEFSDKRFTKARDTNLQHARASDWEGFIAKGLAPRIISGANDFYRKSIEPPVLAAYKPLIEQARAVLTGREANRTLATRQLLDKFDAAYWLLKQQKRALRFDDVTRSLVRGFESEVLGEVGWRLDMRVSHLLLDEFQDTSRLQWHVIRPFAERVTRPGGTTSFFCVGDVKQAIYRWRGGASEIFDAVGRQLGGLESAELTKSYRSSQPVIDTVNQVFGSLGTNAALADYPTVTRLWQERFQAHTTAMGHLPGYCRLMTSRRPAEGENQGDATLVFAAEEIGRIAVQNPGRSIGVLVRTNAAVARLIYELRTHQQVRASEEGGNPLTDSAAVELILSLLRIADHPGNTAARFHVATSPLAAVVGLERHDDDAAALRLSLKIRRSLLSEGYGPTIFEWVTSLAEHSDSRDLSRLMQLVELAHGYESDASLRVDDFIAVVESRRVEDPTAADVRVMTLHQAKGLGFDIVVLPELDVALKGKPPAVVVGRDGPTGPVRRVCRYVNKDIQALLPAEFRRLFDEWADQSVGESLCLLYVALTRAALALHMIIPPSSEAKNKTLPKRLSGLLRAALTDGTPPDPETILYEHGDAGAFEIQSGVAGVERSEPPDRASLGAPSGRPLGRPQPPPCGDNELEPKTLTVRLREAPPRRRRGLDRQTPSGLEGGSAVDLADHLRLEGSAALSRGSLFHAWFEEIEWLDDGVPDAESLRGIAARFVAADFDLDAECDRFQAMLGHSAIQAALSRAGYQDPQSLGFAADVCSELRSAALQFRVWRERPFAIRDGDALLRGSIDRLVLLCDGEKPLAADVIDFKTDAVDPVSDAALEARVDYYSPQIEAYRKAASVLTDLPAARISARLLFVAAGIVRNVSPGR